MTVLEDDSITLAPLFVFYSAYHCSSRPEVADPH